jgi:hypothetical protein
VKRVLMICLFATSTALVGCGDPQPTDIMENADQSAIDAYEAAVAAEDAAMEADPGDADEDGAPAVGAVTAEAP